MRTVSAIAGLEHDFALTSPKTGYSRDEFGPAWADPDRNGCDTRNDIVARDLEGETFKPGTQNCVMLTGTLADKYTGTTINFVRANKTSTLVQIDRPAQAARERPVELDGGAWTHERSQGR